MSTPLSPTHAILLASILLVSACSEPTSSPPPEAEDTGVSSTLVGPDNGTLMLIGGNMAGSLAGERFTELCGGPEASAVYDVSAFSDEEFADPDAVFEMHNGIFGFTDATMLFTRDPVEADTEAYVAPIAEADCVFLSGGRQWRYADVYLGTATFDALMALLDRGGLIGGSSAGASIQGSFLVRGDTETNDIVIGDHLEGFGFLQGVGVDQHVAQRGREDGLTEVLHYDPSLLGIGLDEKTWIEVSGDQLTVDGRFKAYVHDAETWPETPGEEDVLYSELRAGDRYDMGARELLD